MNHHTVDYISQNLPLYIKQRLHTALAYDVELSPSQVSDILASSILRIDEGITSSVLDLFPQECLDDLNDSDIQLAFQRGLGGFNYEAITRSLGGSTLILSLTDSKRNLWVANLGGRIQTFDSVLNPHSRRLSRRYLLLRPSTNRDTVIYLTSTVLGYRNQGEWTGCQINSVHEATNPIEVCRIKDEHPKENPIKDHRILGFLEPTRGEQ
jgi:pyruvate dehydrogenase phosphatase